MQTNVAGNLCSGKLTVSWMVCFVKLKNAPFPPKNPCGTRGAPECGLVCQKTRLMSGYLGGPRHRHRCPGKRRAAHTHQGPHADGGRVGVMQPQARGVRSPQELGEAGGPSLMPCACGHGSVTRVPVRVSLCKEAPWGSAPSHVSGHLEGPGGPGRCPERGFASHGVSTNSHRIPGVRGIARHSPGLSSPAVTETTHLETPWCQKGGEVTYPACHRGPRHRLSGGGSSWTRIT